MWRQKFTWCFPQITASLPQRAKSIHPSSILPTQLRSLPRVHVLVTPMCLRMKLIAVPNVTDAACRTGTRGHTYSWIANQPLPLSSLHSTSPFSFSFMSLFQHHARSWRKAALSIEFSSGPRPYITAVTQALLSPSISWSQAGYLRKAHLILRISWRLSSL